MPHQIVASVVVPNVKLALLTKFLLHHAAAWDWSRHELIIVTSPENAAQLKNVYPKAKWLTVKQNRGFAQTVNAGWRLAKGEWLGTVNDDTELPPGWIQRLIVRAKPDTGSLSPVIIDPSGKVESAGVNYLPIGRAIPVLAIPPQLDTTDTCNAAAILFRKQALDQVGWFDGHFGSYLEDVDLGLRLKRASWQNLVVPTVRVVHYGQQTSGDHPVYKAWLDVKNWWLVVLKNTTPSTWLNSGIGILLERGRNVSGLIKTLKWH